jgi:Tfp pilus assembly protein PilX
VSTLTIVLLVIIVVVAALAIGGAVAQRRRMARNTGVFERELSSVNEELAVARAEDRGWEPATLDAAAREAYASERPGVATPELTLVRIIDRPGTDEDKAIYRTGPVGSGEELTLGRRGGAWVLESLRPPGR